MPSACGGVEAAEFTAIHLRCRGAESATPSLASVRLHCKGLPALALTRTSQASSRQEMSELDAEGWMCYMCNFQNLGGQVCANASCQRDRRLVGVGQCERRRRAVPVRFAPLTPSPDPNPELRRKASPPPAWPSLQPPRPIPTAAAATNFTTTTSERLPVLTAAREERAREGSAKRKRVQLPSDSPSDSASGASMPTSPTNPLMDSVPLVAPLSLNGGEAGGALPMLEAPVLAIEHGAWGGASSDGEDDVLACEEVVVAPTLQLRSAASSPVIVTLPIGVFAPAAHATCGERRALHPKHAFKQQLKESAADGASRERSRASSPRQLPGPMPAPPSVRPPMPMEGVSSSP